MLAGPLGDGVAYAGPEPLQPHWLPPQLLQLPHALQSPHVLQPAYPQPLQPYGGT
jgi:hypothetical protein